MIYPPPKSQSLIYPQIAVYNLPSLPNRQVRFTLKSSCMIYNPPPKSPSLIYPQITMYEVGHARKAFLPPG